MYPVIVSVDGGGDLWADGPLRLVGAVSAYATARNAAAVVSVIGLILFRKLIV